jgi:hypothetical protein
MVTISFHVHVPTVSLAPRPEACTAGVGRSRQKLRMLLAAGTPGIFRPPLGTPLYFAASAGELEILEMLIQHGTGSTSSSFPCGARASSLIPLVVVLSSRPQLPQGACPPRATSAQRYFHPTGSRFPAPTWTSR